MNLQFVISLFSRLVFVAAILLFGLAVVEKIANMAGYMVLSGYEPSRLLELAAIMVVFVIALLLRQIRDGVAARGER